MRKTISTKKAPAAIGPYVQANILNGMVFTSGQIPLDPITGEIIGTTIEEQATQVFKNISAILQEAGTCLNNVVKTTVFIKDMNDFGKLNNVYAQFFTGDNLPSRSAVEVARLPKDVLVEIETIAHV
ncbi:MAG: RidA family protein [Anaerovoracaceae bacterium]